MAGACCHQARVIDLVDLLQRPGESAALRLRTRPGCRPGVLAVCKSVSGSSVVRRPAPSPLDQPIAGAPFPIPLALRGLVSIAHLFPMIVSVPHMVKKIFRKDLRKDVPGSRVCHKCHKQIICDSGFWLFVTEAKSLNLNGLSYVKVLFVTNVTNNREEVAFICAKRVRSACNTGAQMRALRLSFFFSCA